MLKALYSLLIMKAFLPAILLLFIIPGVCAAQATDTTAVDDPLKPTIKQQNFSVQIDAGIHRNVFLSAGLSGNKLIGSGHGNTGYNLHALFEYTPSNRTLFTG